MDGTSITDDESFVVINGSAQATMAAKFINLGTAEATVSDKIDDLLHAYQTLGPAADVTAARTALVAALVTVPITGPNQIQRAQAVAPETGFLPDEGQINGLFPLTAHDVAFGNLIIQIDAKLQQISAFYQSLSPDGTVGGGNAVQQLDILNTQLAGMKAQLLTLNVTPRGIVRYAPYINRLMANTIPQHLHAVTNRVVSIAQQYPDPANVPAAVARLPGAQQFFANLKGGEPADARAYYGKTQPAFFGLLGLFGGSSRADEAGERGLRPDHEGSLADDGGPHCELRRECLLQHDVAWRSRQRSLAVVPCSRSGWQLNRRVRA